MHRGLRRNLDLFCTAFLRRGGWGNFDADPPMRMLYAAAGAASREGVELCDAAGDYVERVLRQAGYAPDDAALVGRKVAVVFETIDGFLQHEASGNEHLEHCAGLPLHPATDPSNDPRWGRPVRRLVFRGGRVEAWTPATDAELEEYGVAVPNRSPDGSAVPLLHREDGPALVLHNDDGTLFEEMWVRHGRVHRDRKDGPAHTLYGCYRRWYENDALVVDVPWKGADLPG